MDITTRPDLRLVIAGSPVDEYEPGYDEPIRLHPFVPARSLADNCYSMAGPLWGEPWAEWAMRLAGDVAERFPGAGRGKQKRGWAAGILLATAAAAGLRADAYLWVEVLHDVTGLSGVSRQTAERRMREVADAGMTRFRAEPDGWRLRSQPGALYQYLDDLEES